MRCLVEAGADREARDAHGDSPLSWASWHRRPADVLAELAFGEHRIHPDAVANASKLRGTGWTQLDLNLLGRQRP